jgi:hypothetical protein
MFGQLRELPRICLPGAWLPWDGAVFVVGVVLLPLVEVVDVAALAIAAPPPARAPVTARVVSNGFRFRIFVHLLSSTCQTILATGRSAVAEA